MKTRKLMGLGAPALLALGASVAGGVAVAADRSVEAEAKLAAAHAAKANKALKKQDAARAIGWAEQAVELSPRDAAHRAMLGQAYLQAGRFGSARAMLEEALALNPGDARTALNVVLAQIATGDWARARTTLDRYADAFPASDRGLAIALTGDPAGAVALLTQAARQPDATAKTRQNLALSLALAGQWQLAKVVAAADMSPADVDRRMQEWAAFAQPRAASDQVAYLLGVQASEDPGRPVTLALNAPVAPVAVTETAPVASPAPTPVAVAAIEPVSAAPSPGLVFAPRAEVVQALPVRTIRPASLPAKVALTPRPQPIPAALKPAAPKPVIATAPARGDWYVQLGAYDSPAVARDAWSRATRRFAAFKGHTPAGMNVSTAKGAFYRLSVGGFARGDAVSLCGRYRARGGVCFVRTGAGDQVALWAKKPGAQLAMR